MSKSHSQTLEELKSCEQHPEADNTKPLKAGLRHRSSLIVQRAAKICLDQERTDLIDTLLEAYPRFLRDPSKSDNGCVAKQAIANALWRLGHGDHDFYLDGIRYVQLDPVFGPPVDSAAELRVICGYALLENGYPYIMRELVDLLADQEKTARAGAIRAIAGAGHPASALLLRHKVHAGDEAAEVMGECYSALLQISPSDALPLVAAVLSDRRGGTSLDTQLEAAVALGESRRPEAVEPLLAFARRLPDPATRPIVYSAIALVRQPKAVEFLIAQVRPDNETSAIAAITAIASSADRESIKQRLSGIVADLNDLKLSQAFTDSFADESTK